MNDASELVAQERAARVTALLYQQGYISLRDAITATGLTYSGVWYLMSKIARVTQCWYDRAAQTWILER